MQSWIFDNVSMNTDPEFRYYPLSLQSHHKMIWMYADTVQNSCTVMKSIQLQRRDFCHLCSWELQISNPAPSEQLPLRRMGMPMEWSPGIFLVEIDSMTLTMAIDLKGLLHPKIKSVTFFLLWNKRRNSAQLHLCIYCMPKWLTIEEQNQISTEPTVFIIRCCFEPHWFSV